MTQGVQDLIKAIDSGDSQVIDAAFQAEMANRISTRLEDLRVSVAQNMFATEQSVEEDQVEEELTLEDYSVEEIEEFMQTEDFEQLDELKKKTVGSYLKGRVDDLTNKSIDSDDTDYSHIKAKHMQGIDRAAKRLGDKKIAKHAKAAIDHGKDFQHQYHHNMDDREAVHAQDDMEDSKAKLSKAVDKATRKK
jgi:hypothetical protein